MDKTNSFRCVKSALIAGNAAVIVLGVTGFLVGLIQPDILLKPDFYTGPVANGVSGSQVALVSCVAVVVAAEGLIGAWREHFHLLLVYVLCIVATFVFRLFWWLTAHLHQSERFLLDVAVSVTLLSSLAKLFLLLFAILEALTVKNSLPLTKKKFLILKSKLKPNRSKSSAKSMKKPNKPKPSIMKHKLDQTDNSIYVTSSSIYGSGRSRRSPGRTSTHNSSYGSSRARKYLPGVGYSSSPNTSQSSQDSNNNKNPKDTSLNTKASSTPPVIDDHHNHRHHHPQQQQHPQNKKQTKNFGQEHYYHFQSPTPSTPTSLTEPPVQVAYSKYPNQSILAAPGLGQHRRSPKLAPASPGQTQFASKNANPPMNGVGYLPQRQNGTLTSSSWNQAKYQTNLVPSTASNSLTSRSSPSYYSTPRNYSQMAMSSSGGSSSYVAKSSTYSSPQSIANPTSTTFSSSYTSRAMYSSSPNIVTSTPKPSQTRSPLSSSTYQPANLFTYSSPKVTSAKSSTFSSIATTTTTSSVNSNLNQTRSLFSTYTSPYASNLASQIGPANSPISSYNSSQPPLDSSQSNYLQLSLGHSPVNQYGDSSSHSTPVTSTPAVTTHQQNSSTNLFARVYPKSYEEYVKAYRYPSQYSAIRTADTTTATTGNVPTTVSSQPIGQLASGGGNDSVQYRQADSRKLISSSTTTTTKSEHREMTEHQKRSIYYQQIIKHDT